MITNGKPKVLTVSTLASLQNLCCTVLTSFHHTTTVTHNTSDRIKHIIHEIVE